MKYVRKWRHRPPTLPDDEKESSKVPLTNLEDAASTDEKYKSASYWQMLRYAKTADYFLVFFGLVLSIIDGLCAPLGSVIFRGMTDTLMAGHADYLAGNFSYPKFSEGVIFYSGMYFLQGVNMFVLTLLATGCFYTLSERQAYQMKKHFFQSVIKQDMEWFDRKQVGSLTQLITSGVDKIRNGTSDKLVLVIKSTAGLISGIAWAFYFSVELTLVIIGMAPIMCISLYMSHRILIRESKKEAASYSIAGAIAEEVLSGIRTVIAFNAQIFELGRYEETLTKAKKIGFRKAFVVSLCSAFFVFVEFATMALGFWYGGRMVFSGTITPGTVFGVFWCIFISTLRFSMALPQLATLAQAKVAAGEILAIIDAKANLDRSGGMKPDNVEGRLDFTDIHFTYPSRKSVKVLNGVSFSVEPGQNVALVGHSGCGKSTLIGLLMRYYQQETGSISIDGVPIEDLNVEWLRRRISVVSQEPVLFKASVGENLRMGKQDATQEEMEEACRAANAHEFVLRLPQGYDTVIGDGGVKLSGGQKQRIAIARALIRQPKVLLLDEATSALDTESERLVQTALDNAAAGRTTITIAHRLSTVRNADRIVVFDQGQIVESGTHDELMEVANGFYRKLVTAQKIDKVENSSEEASTSPRRSRLDSALSKSTKSLTASESEETNDEGEMEELLRKKGAKPASIFAVLCYAKREMKLWISGFILSLIRGSAWPAFAVVYGLVFVIYSTPNSEESKTALNWTVLEFLLIGLGGGLATLFSGFLLGVVGEKVNVRLRMDMYRNLMRQDVTYFDDPLHSVGMLTSRLATDSNNVQAAIDQRLADLLQGMTSLVVGLTVAFYFGWNFAPCCLVTSVVFIVVQVVINARVRKRALNDTPFSEMEATISNESIANVKTVQGLAREEHIFELFEKASREPRRRAIIRGWLQSVVYSIAAAFVSFNFFLSYLIGMLFIREGFCTPFTVFQVIEALNIATLLIMGAASYFPEYSRAKLSAGLIFHMLKQEPRIDNLSDEGSKPEASGDVEVRAVSFAYPNTANILTLTNMSVSAPFGRTVALVGPSGGGKTTLIQLLERFYDVSSGSIKIDGNDCREFNVRHLRSMIGLVGQEPTLFNLSIRDNITYGLEDVPEEEVQEAARLANIDKFVESLPLGFDTSAGSKGTQLSGGQRQRIAIARAVVRKPKILLLDEATAALDSESEKLVQEALDRARDGRTCFVIAHRLSTVQNADSICVIKEGRCIESGTHQQLLQRKGLYARLVSKQMV